MIACVFFLVNVKAWTNVALITQTLGVIGHDWLGLHLFDALLFFLRESLKVEINVSVSSSQKGKKKS